MRLLKRRTVTGSLRQRLEQAVGERVFPGCVLGVVGRGENIVIPAGKLTYDSDAPAVSENTIYDVASVTKAIPVSCGALKLMEKKALSAGDLMIRYLPEYNGSYREKIRISHLLTHTLDFDFRLSSCKDLSPKEMLSAIFNAGLRSEPGKRFFYANATSILLGLVVEKVSGLPLDRTADEFFFKPLCMDRTTFFPEKLDREWIAPTEFDPWRNRIIRGEVHDESAWALRPHVIAGSAGVFSTVPDLMKFAGMLIAGGKYAGREYFTNETIPLMHANQRPPGSGEWTGLGWELNQEYMGSVRNGHRFGKTGFTGCVVVIDPLESRGFILLSNHTYPKRRDSRDLINKVRRDIADLVFGK